MKRLWAVLTVGLMVCLVAWAGSGRLSSARGAASPSPAHVSFVATGNGPAIPPSFLGLSIEYKELNAFEQEGDLFDQVVDQIKPEDGSPLLVRIGGKSADHVYWNATRADPPQWVSVIGPTWVSKLAALVKSAHLQVMLDLNLAVHSPALETDFATAVRAALPPGSLAALEVGNEPDLYWRQLQLEKQRIPSTDAAQNWAVGYSAASYRRDYLAYARALAARLPGVALAGPEIISANAPWLNSVEGLGAMTPKFLTIHRYASSTCWGKGSPWYPTIPLMLSETATAGLAATVAPAIALARHNHQGVRLTEVNSISCGGNAGVANSFATALWAPDALFELLHAGVQAVSWETRPGTLNAPFLAQPASVSAQPELYGLAMFAQMTAPGAVLLNGRFTEDPSAHVKVWAVHYGSTIRVLVINKGSAPAVVSLGLGQTGPAFVKSLLAPAVAATTGETFGGQTIGPDGRWQGTLVAPAVPVHNGIYTLTIPGYSAAMLTVH